MNRMGKTGNHALWQRLRGSRLFKNASWIFFGNIAYSALHFLLGIFAARLLPIGEKGILDYSMSLVAFLTSLASLGFGSVITRELVTHEKQEGDYICSCMTAQCAASVVAILAMQVVVRIINSGETLVHSVVFWHSTSMLFGMAEMLVYWFRYKHKPGVPAVWRLVAFVLTAVARVIALGVFRSLKTYVALGMVETAVYCFMLILSYFRLRTHKSFHFSFAIVKKMLRASYPFIFAAVLTTIYAQMDKWMLKFLMDNEAVALYSTSVQVAGLLSTIPTALVEAFRPDIMENKIRDEKIYRRRLRQLYAIVFWSSIAYCLVVTIFGREILWLLYHDIYLGSLPSLSLVVWYTAFSYFGAVNNLYMVAEKKASWVQVTTLVGALCNVALNFVCIPRMGTVGAALASLITQIVTNFLMMLIVPDLRPGFKQMIRGILLRDIR